MLTLEQKLRQFIDEKRIIQRLYAELAAIAPNDDFRQLLMAMSNDEGDHAKAFQRILHQRFGQYYHPQVVKPILRSTFDEILWNRVLEETSDYRKYDYEYLRSQEDRDLAHAYYVAKTDDSVHAIRLLYMLVR